MNITTFKCACCGAELKYSPGQQTMKCEYCGTEFDAEAVEAMADAGTPEESSFAWQQSSREQLETDPDRCEFACSSCGAVITGDKSLAASLCPYCGNTVVVSSRLEGMLRPDYVIPFKIDKAAAMEKFRSFCKGKLLLPGGFISSSRIEKVEGLYVPYWLFDANAHGRVQYRAERVRSWREGDYRVTKTDHFLLMREGGQCFERVPVDGTSKLGGDITEAVEPFDMNGAKEFAKAYLSGFLADRYDVDAEQSKPRARERIRNSMTAALAATCTGYSSVRPQQENITVTDGRISYALLPMWLMTVSYKGKHYRFAMNGQTGKFVGELPVSAGKFWGFLVGFTVLFTVIATILYNMLG